MRNKPALFFLFPFLLLSANLLSTAEPPVTLGNEVMLNEKLKLLEGKRIGLITNPSGVDGNLVPFADKLAGIKNIRLIALFGPEHGIRGEHTAGKKVGNITDKKTGLPVYSLYGKKTKPDHEMLKDIDILLFDIQDVGLRCYTYISTMKECMEAAKENNIKFIVLDRPNPINGTTVDGPVAEKGFFSFIGIGPIAFVHGMTIGELALFFNTEMNIGCDLEVVRMKGWRRDMSWKDTGLFWIPTSPHIPEFDTPLYYPLTAMLDETSGMNNGVGYTLPFKIIGAPWIDADRTAEALNGFNLPGIYFLPFYFTPYYKIYKDASCGGVRIIVKDINNYRPAEAAIHILRYVMSSYPQELNFEKKEIRERIGMFDKGFGTDQIRKMLTDGKTADEIIKSYQHGLREFIEKRKKYLLYE